MKTETFLTPFECKFAESGQVGTFEGYAAVFGNTDAYGDVIKHGAFKETMRGWKKAKRLPPMLLQHGGGMFGGTAEDLMPVGKWTSMSEDEKGLNVEGRLINLDTERGKSVYGAMKEGVLDGLSIGFRTKKFTLGTKPGEPRRMLEGIDLLEASLVTMPANDQARVSGVKAIEDIKTIRDFEDILREVGFSNAAARGIALHGFKASEPRDEDEADIAVLLRRNIATLIKR